MDNLLLHLPHHLFDMAQLNDIFESIRRDMVEYSEKRGNVPGWDIGRLSKDTPYIKELTTLLNIPSGKPRFYYLNAGVEIPEHIDNGTLCSINVLLGPGPHSPIIIGGHSIDYKCCLLNTTIPHSVPPSDYDRVLFKISLQNSTFDEIKEQLVDLNYISGYC